MAAIAGVGSAWYHGPGGRLGRAAHDAGLVMLAVTVPGAPGRRWVRRVGAACAGVAAVARPGMTSTIAAFGLTANLVGGALRIRNAAHPSHPARLVGIGAALAAGAMLHASSRTGGPLSRPDSRLQGHGAWHLLSAVGLGWWSQTVLAAGAAPNRGPR